MKRNWHKIGAILFAVSFVLMSVILEAQELRCNISINSARIQGTNRSIFTTLQRDLYEYMNATAWTNHIYAPDERIECSMLITITEQMGGSEFKGTLQINALRPVYGSYYTTTLLNYMDNEFQFYYLEYDKIEFNENTYTSALSSIMAFYAYIIIGLDDDSFSLRGGTECFKKAEKIVLNAQNAADRRGWRPYEGSRQNRYWMIENILNPKYGPNRVANYKYHRLGLDRMGDKINEAREETMNALLEVQKVYREKPDMYLFYLKLFFDAKADEIVNIFSEAPIQERTRAYQLLAEVDKANERKYAKLKETSQTTF